MRKVQSGGQFARLAHQIIARLYAVDMRCIVHGLEKQIVKYKTQIGFSGTMIHQIDLVALLQHCLQQGLDELV